MRPANNNLAGFASAFIMLAALSAATMVGSSDAAAETYTIKVSHAVTTSHPGHRAMERFKEIVESESNGQLDVRIFHSSQLAGQREGVESLQAGAIEITLTPNGVIAGFDPTFSLMDIPFQFHDLEHARGFIDEHADELLFANLDDVGLVGLAVWEQGFRNLATIEEPVLSLEDVKGLRVRTMEAPLHLTAWRSLGANPTPIGWAQVYSSLQQGVISGVENPSYIFSQTPVHEILKYLSITQHIYDPIVVLGSKTFFNSLPDDLRELVTTTLRELTDEQREMAAEDVRVAEEADLPAYGVEIVQVPPEVVSSFAQGSQEPVLEEIVTLLGSDTVQQWRASVAAARPE